MSRAIVRLLAAAAILAALAAAGSYLYLRRSLPIVDGRFAVGGLSAPVEIIRDADNVPHIFAATRAEALYGLGFVHAQDRLWQMEFQRRIGHGRLSEIFGAPTIPQDRFLRTMGFGRAARSAWERLPDDARRLIDAYTAGINAYIAAHGGSRLPPEFTLLGVEPEPWTGADVMAWVKMMAWDLSANYSQELMRHDLAAAIGPERMAELLPPYPANGPSIVPSSVPPGQPDFPLPRRLSAPLPGSAAPGALSYALARGLSSGPRPVRNLLLGGSLREAIGSNSWVIGGALTASGRPLLANDPHLGTNVPSLWYLAHMSAEGFDLIGATLPGTPAVAIGRNRHIAWGETNVAADVQDLYRERLDPSGTSAEFRGVFEPLTVMNETIEVGGGDPIRVAVRISRHGPLISDAINANNAEAPGLKAPALDPLAFRWTALDETDTTIVAFLRLNEARNWAEFTSALRHFVVPSQNFVYADVEGHIGYYAPGRIPIRMSGDGSQPAEGWTGEMEWTGWIPFEELPHAFDPPEQVIVAANHRPMPAGYRHHISLEYPEPYRAQRIWDLIRQGGKFTPDDLRAMQADTFSLHASTVLPRLLERVQPREEIDRRAVDVLRRWDFNADGRSAAAAIFQAWFLRLAPAMVADELGPSGMDGYKGRYSFFTRFLAHALSAESAWCDNVGTAGSESCNETVTAALHEGVALLSRTLGGEPAAWRWDAVHRVVFPHQGLDAVRLLRPFLSRDLPSAGDWSTINVGPVDAEQPFEQREIPSYRQIIDLSPANDSRFLDSVGQSGHFLSTHYDDSLRRWREVHHLKMRMDRAEIERGAIGRLTLTPR